MPYKTFLLFLFCCFTHISAVSIAITIDDYPLSPGPMFTIAERTHKFIEAGNAFNCPIAFFCVGTYYKDRGQEELFLLLQTHGHFLANHSTTHTVSSKLTPEEFYNEIFTTEQILTPHVHYKKWFRYPGLDYGNQKINGGSADKKEAFLQILENLGYADGYVTVDSYDWYINRKVTKALQTGKTIDYTKLRDFYVSLVEDRIKFYTETYVKVFNKEVTHSLLFHDNDLTALYLYDILAMIRHNGWDLVSPEIAFTNPAWREKIALLFSKHIPWLSFAQVGELFDAAEIIQN